MSAILVLSFIVAIIASASTVVAHDPGWDVPTFAYVSVNPNPSGVNQPVGIVMWLNCFPPTANGQYGDRWQGFQVEVTKPDNSKETLGPFTSDPVGSRYTTYTPDQVGTYKFVFSWPGQKITGLPIPPGQTIDRISGAATVNDTYLGSTSDPVFLTVQQQPIEAYQNTPVPTGYWTRPVHGSNHLWYEVTASWLGPGAFQRNGPTTNFAYGKGPESAHILWTLPYYTGGTMDARFGSNTYYTGLSYETYWSSSSTIIMNGKLYFNDQTNPRYGWYCVDLRSGKVDYFRNTTGPVVPGGSFSGTGSVPGQALSFGQIYAYDSPNQHGGFAYLWSTNGYQGSGTWDMFDQFSGDYICSIANVTQRVRTEAGTTVTIGATGTQVYGKDGSVLYYNIVNMGTTDAPKYYLQVWNNTYAIWYQPVFSGNSYWFWRPNLNQTFNGENGFSLNVSIPNLNDAGRILEVREGQYVIGGTSGKNNGTYIEKGQLWALNLDPNKGEMGSLLWNITFTPPQTSYNDYTAANILASYPYGLMTGPRVNPEDGVFIFTESFTRRYWGYSLATGEQIWGPTAPEPQWNFYGMNSNFYQGKLLSTGYGGELNAYDIKTGELLWNWSSGTVGFEGYYGGNAPLSIGAIADGKIYLYSTEHSPSTPLRRDSMIWCVNAENGELLWKITCWAAGISIGDGYLVTLDLNDNQIYCYGIGPSQTTVSTQEFVAPLGSSVLIKGTVTDQSPGAKGTPAISDADQKEWMEHIYHQRPQPANAKGVPVLLTAIDEEGKYYDIGTATSDIGGSYGITWTPPAEGTYQIIATFEGSKSYGSSYATTYLAVGPAASSATQTPSPTTTIAPTTTVAPTDAPTSSSSPSPSPIVDNPDAGSGAETLLIVGAAVVIIVVVAVAALLLRKRA